MRSGEPVRGTSTRIVRRPCRPAVLGFVLITLFAQRAMPQQSQPLADSPPNPLRLGEKQREAGNPLAGYVQLLRLEDAYRAAGQEQLFFDARANLQACLGDTQGALESWARLMPKQPDAGVPASSPLDDFTPSDAVATIAAKAGDHNVIMIGEEHVQPQTRSILKPLLRELWNRGFRYFAAETFNADLSSTVEAGYTLFETGTYTREPVFAEAVTEAIRLGYRLVPYEQAGRPEEDRPDDPLYAQNWRELGQARNLKERIFDKDPKAKVLVWAGRGHIAEEAGDVPGLGTLKPMGYQFTKLTGIDPFTVYLPSGCEQASPEFESGFYRFATDKGWVSKPTIFTNSNGETFAAGGDAAVFFPRVTMKSGRPDWLVRELGRVATPIPVEILTHKGYRLVQAFGVEDFARAIPLDQVLIEPDDEVPSLMLPKGSTCWVRCIDESGEVHGPVKLTAP